MAWASRPCISSAEKTWARRPCHLQDVVQRKMNFHQLHFKAVIAVRACPRITWTITATLVFVAVWGLRTLSDAGPSKASAGIAVRSNPPTGKSDTTVQSHSDSGAFVAWASLPASPITRNIFYINLDRFPQDGLKPVASAGPVSGATNEGFWDRLAKSGALRAEDQDSHSQLIGGLQWQAAQLHLQSILMGPTPKVMVDGKLLKEGDVVAGFRVVRITARGILLERDGSKFEVAFK